MDLIGQTSSEVEATAAETGPVTVARRHLLQGSAAVALLGLASVPSAESAAATVPACTARTPGGPVQVTPECRDPEFAEPIVDTVRDVRDPVEHRRISGHFQGTATKFNVYLPTPGTWKGRFFQWVYPIQDENATDRTIAFGAASGAYTVQVTGAGGYRHEAAAAKYSRTLAAEYYRARHRRIYGYVYGASGGSFQTIGAIEN